MSDDTRSDDILAAEYAVGLLEGEELLAARARLAGDAGFAEAVGWWEQRLAPLLDEVGGAAPSADLLSRIESEIAGAGDGPSVVQLERKLTLWRWTAGAAVAASAALMVFTILPSQGVAPPVDRTAQAPLVSSIPIADTDLRLAVTYLPDRGEMLVSASGLAADGVHDHELWLVPDEGELRSLGVVRPGEEMRVALDPALADMIGDGSRMVLTREPIGGKPEGQDAGPVVAEGQFSAV